MPLWNTGGCSKVVYTNNFGQVEFEKSMSVEVFVGISAKKEKKKEKSWSQE